MARCLIHRGPDDEGVWSSARGELSLGFRRLSILDLSPEGHQPMQSASARFSIAFNGEIYNFADLRKELEVLGHHFRGRSDTEVLLAAFSEWGIGPSLPRLWGMFAIALWDEQERALHLIRDRLGKKPLYYGWQGSVFLFGSELKALRAHPAFRAPVDRSSLASFLQLSYVPAPHSIYEGISKLAPAAWITVRLDQGRAITNQPAFWSAAAAAEAGLRDPLQLSDAEAEEALDKLLADAVSRRMVADVPIGAFLSGGVDSSTVVALMRAGGTSARTFTIGFAETEYDESGPAAAVARHLGCEHTELLVRPEEARAVIPKLPSIYDEPFADSSQIPTFLVAQLAQHQVTVALSGDGGDEVFGGYNRYLAGTGLWSALNHVPAGFRSRCTAAIGKVAPATWDRAGAVLDLLLPRQRRGMLNGNRAQKVASLLAAESLEALYLRLVSTWPDPEALLSKKDSRAVDVPHLVSHPWLPHPAQRMMLTDLTAYLPDDILVKVDRATMAVSLEARAPFLDHRIVEFAWRLPFHQKVRDGEGKWLLRRVLERYVPTALTNRQKQGFGVPIDAWLRGPLREWAEELLGEKRLRAEGFFVPAAVRDCFEEHLSNRANRQHELWAVLMFQAWLECQRRG